MQELQVPFFVLIHLQLMLLQNSSFVDFII